MPEFKVEIVKLQGVTKHPNANSLSCVQIFGQNVIFRTGDFKEGDLATYVPYDAVVHVTDPTFKFLQKKPDQKTVRIKPVRLRGVYSEGVLVPAPKHAKEGDDVASYFAITKYVEPEDTSFTPAPSPKRTWQGKVKTYINGIWWRVFGTQLFNMKVGDPGYMPKYDLEQYLRNKSILTDPAALDIDPDALKARPLEVVVTEKLHGSNARFLYYKRRFWVASHGVYRNTDDNSMWWRIAKSLDLKSKLKRIKGIAVYGEVYGQGVQDLTYSRKGIDFRVFDMYDVKERKWLDFDRMNKLAKDIGLEVVPVLYRGPYIPEIIEPLRSGKSTLDENTIREGIVIKPAKEVVVPRFGRLALKYVSEEYKMRNGGSERK